MKKNHSRTIKTIDLRFKVSIIILIYFTIYNTVLSQNIPQIQPNSNIDYPSFINKEVNYFEYKNKKIIETLINKWNNGNSRFVIAHFGDSHVQPDYFTGTVRDKLQKIKGNAGRGMIFPYSLAKTYSQHDYTSSYKGNWNTANSIQIPPRLPVGLSGFTGHTKERNASFTITSKKLLSKGKKIVKIYCETTGNNYSLKVQSGNDTCLIKLDTISTKKPYIQITLNNIDTNITFTINKSNTNDNVFILYGIVIENPSDGVLYHNLGVGGACFSGLLYQKKFENEFPSLNSDLVVCDWGGNDFMYKNSVEPELEHTMIKTIKKIRNSSPNSVILLTSAQDINKKGKNITAAKQYAKLARKVAMENDCLFYDWFVVSGGGKSMDLWHENNIASKDNVHLNVKGYKLKGELFAEAFLKSVNQQLLRDSLLFKHDKYYLQDSINQIIKIDSSKQALDQNLTKIKEIKTTQGYKNTKRNIIHKVKKGETLRSIGLKYKVSLSDLKKWNSLKSDKINIGKKIIVKIK